MKVRQENKIKQVVNNIGILYFDVILRIVCENKQLFHRNTPIKTCEASESTTMPCKAMYKSLVPENFQ